MQNTGTGSAISNTGFADLVISATAMVTSSRTSIADGTIYNSSGGTLTISGGTVRNTAERSTPAYAIYHTNANNGTSGRLDISGGTVESENSTAISISGVTGTISGGTIRGTAAPAIIAGGPGTLTISQPGETPTLVTATTATKTDGALRVVSSSGLMVVNISGGTVEANSASGYGAAIYCSFGEVTVNISGGTVRNTGIGSAIYNKTGTVNISQPAGSETLVTTIPTDTTAATIFNSFYNSSSGTITVSGGTVQNTGTGDAIYNGGPGTVSISQSAGSETLVTSGCDLGSERGTIYNSSSGTITVSGGTVQNTGNSFAIYNKTGTVNISQPAGSKTQVISNSNYNNDSNNVIKATISNRSSGTITISGGAVKNTGDCPALYNGNQGTIAISQSAGSETLVTSKFTYLTGATIFNTRSSIVTISGGTVENTAAFPAIHNQESGTVEISQQAGSETLVTSNCTSVWGTIANIVTGSVTVSGGKVENTSTTGSALFDSASGLTITGGVIESADTAIKFKASGDLTLKGGRINGANYGISTTRSVNVNGPVVVQGGLCAIYIDNEEPSNYLPTVGIADNGDKPSGIMGSTTDKEGVGASDVTELLTNNTLGSYKYLRYDYLPCAETPEAVFEATGYNTGTLSNLESGMKYRIGDGSWTDCSTTSVGLTNLAPCTIYVVRKGDGTSTADSTAQELTVTRAAAPLTPAKTDCSAFGVNDGTLTGVTASMEWQKEGGAWAVGDGETISGLAAGTYCVRVKASGTALTSNNQTLSITAPAQTFTITAPSLSAANGVAAAVAFSPTGPQEAETQITATVTLTGTATAPGRFSILLSCDNGVTVTPAAAQTLNVTAGQEMTASDKFDFTFTLPAKNVTLSGTYGFIPALTGTVVISGEARYGQTLTAELTGSTDHGTLSYQWKRDGTAIGTAANGSQYLLTEADIDHFITCEVTSSVKTAAGVTSAPTAAVDKAEGPSAPADLAGVKPSLLNAADGKITGTKSTMEYADNSSFTGAADCAEGETTGLAAKTYHVREKETATRHAGAAAQVVVPAGDPATYTASVTPEGSLDFGTSDWGYAALTPTTITVTSTGNQPLTNLSAALSGADADSFTLNTADMETTLATAGDASTTSFTIAPKTALAVKAYSASLTVTADTGVSIVKDLSFTVRRATWGGSFELQELRHRLTLTGRQTAAFPAGLPGDTGTKSFAVSTVSDANGLLDSGAVSIDADTGELSYTLTGAGAANNSATFTVTVSTEKYDPILVNYKIVMSALDVPVVEAEDITMVYTGIPLTGSDISGTATFTPAGGQAVTVPGSWSFGGTPDLTSAGSRSVTVNFTPEDDSVYAAASDSILLSISKATPTGAPTFTPITASGQTLASAPLAIGSLLPTGGSLTWDLGGETIAEANTAYAWTYTPADTVNYAPITGSFTPYVPSVEPGYTEPTYVVPVESENGGVNSTATLSNGTATVSVNTDVLEELLNAENTSGFIDIDAGLGRRIDTVSIPAAVVNSVAAAANDAGKNITGLSVAADTGTVSLDAAALAALSSQTVGSRVSVRVEEITQSSLSAKQREAMIGDYADDLIVEVTITSGNTVISNYDGGKITVTMPYELKEGEVAAGVRVWHLASDGTLSLMACTYDVNTKTVSFVTDHLSDFIVGYEAPQSAWVNPFADVKSSDWFYGDVAYVCENKLMNGTGDATFAPTGTTTRGMIVTILYRLEGRPAVSGASPFEDVGAGKYYENAVKWAAANKIVDGYSDVKFGPEDPITREQMATILFRYAQYKGYDVSVGEDTNILSYRDAFDISEYAIPTMQWACGAGLIQGDAGNLMPRDSAERCQSAALLHRFIEKAVQ